MRHPASTATRPGFTRRRRHAAIRPDGAGQPAGIHPPPAVAERGAARRWLTALALLAAALVLWAGPALGQTTISFSATHTGSATVTNGRIQLVEGGSSTTFQINLPDNFLATLKAAHPEAARPGARFGALLYIIRDSTAVTWDTSSGGTHKDRTAEYTISHSGTELQLRYSARSSTLPERTWVYIPLQGTPPGSTSSYTGVDSFPSADFPITFTIQAESDTTYFEEKESIRLRGRFILLGNQATPTFSTIRHNSNDLIFDLVEGPLPAPTAIPTTPANLTATAGRGAATLAWDAVDTTSSNTNRVNDVQITKHQVRQSTDGGTSYGNWTDIPDSAFGELNATGHVIDGLTDGTTYTFQVRAVNSFGNSAAATAVMATPDAAAPARPAGLVATAGNTQVTLTWTNPGDATILEYQYQQKAGGAAFGDWTRLPGSTATTTSYRFGGLTNGTAYSYRLRALNRAGKHSVPSATVAATPQAALPAAPVLTAVPKSRGVTLTWPTQFDGSITGYEYQYRVGAGAYTSWQPARELRSGSSSPLYFSPPHVYGGAGVYGSNIRQFPVGGLTAGTTHTFRIRAVNANGATVSNEASATPTTGVPAKPTGLRTYIQISIPPSRRLSWNMDKDASLLRYEFTVDNGRTWAEIGSPRSEGAIGRLPDEYRESDHTYRVRAVNDIGPGPASEPATVEAREFIGFFILDASLEWNQTTRKATLSWDQTEDARIGWWNIFFNTRVHGHNNGLGAILAGGITRYEIPGTFNAGSRISVFIVACVQKGCLPHGTGEQWEINFDVGGPQTAVTGFSATPGNAAVTLAWNDPMDSGITHYEYEMYAGVSSPLGQNSIPDGPDAGSSAADETSHTVTVVNNVSGVTANTPLENGRDYRFRLRAANANGGGPWTEWTENVVPQAKGIPAAPSGVVSRLSIDGTVSVTTWDDPQDPSIIAYQWYNVDARAWQDIPGTDATTTGVDFQLPSLRARNANGIGPLGISSIAPSPRPSRPTGLQAGAGNRRVTLTWDDLGSDIAITSWRYTADGGKTWVTIPDSRTTAEGQFTRHVVTGLTNGQAYSFAVLAENGETGPPSATVSATPQAAAPARPAGLSVTPGNAQAVLAWNDPSDPSITKYQVSQGNAAFADIAASDADTVSHTVTGLTNGTAVDFRIRAVNDHDGDGTDDPGPASDAVRVTPGVPAAPATFSVTPGNAQVALAWTAPASTGGSAVLGYEYTANADAASPTWTDVPDGTDGGTSRADETGYTVTSLTNNTPYAFAVRAENANGPGAATPVRRAIPAHPDAPQRPAAFRAVPGHQKVTLRWAPPNPVQPVTAYRYRRSADGGTTWSPDWTAITGSGAATVSHALTGLTNGTTYTFELRALNGSTVGPAVRTQAVPSAVAAAQVIRSGSATGREYTTADGSTYTVTELSLPDDLDWRLTVSGTAAIDGRTFLLRSLQGTTPETSPQYKFTSTGQEGMDIEVSSSLGGPTQVCLEPSDLLRKEAVAAGESLLLLRHDGTWTALATTYPDGMVCGMTTSFSAFVLGYADPQANEAPQASGSVPAQTVVTGRTVSVNVAPRFEDPNDDALTYTAESSDTARLTVAMTGSELRLTGVAAGTATVTVTATDPDGETATRTVSVTVQANAAPAAAAIPAQSLNVQGLPKVLVDLTRYFSDANGDALTYGVGSGHDTGVVTPTLRQASGVLTLTAVAAGSTTVTVTAEDPDGEDATATIAVTVTANTAPTVGTLPGQTLVAGRTTPTRLNLAPYFSDADNDPLTYTATSGNTSLVTVTVTGSLLNLTGVAVGSATVTVRAEDPAGAAVSSPVAVTVTGANSAPTVTSIPAQTLVLNVIRTVQVPLNTYFNDLNNDALTYTPTSGDTSVVAASVNAATGVLTLTAAAVSTTPVTVTVTASDPDGATVSGTISVTVSANPLTNVAPVATQVIPAQDLTVGGAAVTLDLSTYFRDPNTGDTLSYSAPSPDANVLTTAVSGDQLTLTAVAAGSATVTVTATESHTDGGTARLGVTVTVRPANRAPVQVAAIPDQKLVLNVVNEALVPLNAYFRDPDNDSLTYTATSGDTSLVTVTVTGSELNLTAVAVGTTPVTVEVTAADPDGLQALLSVAVTVTAAPSGGGGGGGSTGSAPPADNDPPVAEAQPIPPQTVPVGDTSAPMDLAPYFEDPDGDPLTYTASSDDVSVVITNLPRGDSRLTLYGVAGGDAVVTVTASDPHGGSVSRTLTVTTTATAQPQAGSAPEVAQRIPPQTVAVGAAAEPLDLTPYFHDADGDPLTYVAVSYDTAVLVAEVPAGSSRLTLRGVAVGDAGVIVTASDPHGGHVSQPLTVAVQPIPPQTVAAGKTSEPLDLAPYFHDADGGPLTYAVLSSDADVLVAEVTAGSSHLTLSGVAAGDAVVTVTASDPQGVTIRRRLTVTVTPPASTAPEVAARIPPQAVLVGTTSEALDLTPYFRDPDGDPLTYAVMSHDADVLVAEIVAGSNQLTLRAVAIGQAVVTVTASDPHGGHASQPVVVTVRTNAAPEVAQPLPPLAVLAGGASAPLDLTPYFQDPDGDPLDYTVVADNAAVLAVEMTEGDHHLTLRGAAVGEAVIVVVASDPFGDHASQIVTVTVRMNTVLEVAQPIPPQTAVAGAANEPLDLTPYFLDPDGDPLTYTAASSNGAVLVAEVAAGDNHLTLRGVAAGEAVVIVTASDPFGEHARQFVTVTVRRNAVPRTLQPIPPQTVPVGAAAAPLDLTPYFLDPDGDPLTYVAAADNVAVLVAEVTAGSSRLTLRGVAAGDAVVTVMAIDSYGVHATQTVTVTVQAGTAPQALRPIPPQTVPVGGAAAPLDLTPYFHDPDGDPLTYTALPVNPAVRVAGAGRALSLAPHVHDAAAVLVAEVAPGGNRLTLHGVAAGQAAVVVTASDPHGGHASQTVTVAVQANAVPQVVQPIPPQTVLAGDAVAPLHLAPHFHDPDGDPLAYVAVSDNPAVLVAEVAKGSNLLTLRGLAAGDAVVMVTAGDPHGGYATQAVTVTVWTNAAPEVAQPIPPQTLLVGAAGEPLHLAPYFHDPDGDPLTYAALSANPQVATAAVADALFTVTGVAAGAAVVTVTARDPHDAAASQTVTVTVAVADPAWVQAWIARFGRTVAGQVLDGVQERLRVSRQAGFEATLAGHRLGGSAEDEDEALDGDAAAFRRELGALAGWMDEQMDAPTTTSGGTPGQALTGRDLLTSTAFTLTGGDADSGFGALWGRGAVSHFAGEDGALSLDGEVATGMLGADWVSGRWLTGLTLALSRGTGAYRAAGGSGDVESTLTGLYPWLGYHVTDRLSVWTAVGYGAGTLTLTPQDQASATADMTLTLVAAGARSDLLELPQLGGILLALETDTRLTRTATDATADLDATDATVWQVRLGLEGSRHVALPGGGALRPSIELGLRHDGGDAETGGGIDVGAGLTFTRPESGLSLDLAARGLLAHRASGFREWGASAALAWDPTPSSDHGLSMSLQQSVGASPSGGMHALLARDTMAAAPEVAGLDGAGRLQARLGYGLPLGAGRFVGTPQLGFGLSGGRHDVTLGWHLSVARQERLDLTVGVEASRRENPDAGNPEHGVMLQLRLGH